MHWKKIGQAMVLITMTAVALSGCGKKPVESSTSTQALDTPIQIEHKLGVTTLTKQPQRVAVLDMNEADFLDQLEVPIAGMVKDYVPHFLSQYKDDLAVQDLGGIVQPNMERVHVLKPDLVLMTSNQTQHYQELTAIAPTLHFDVDFGNSQGNHLAVVKAHMQTLGRIFDKEKLASQKLAELDAKVAAVQQLTKDRPEKALIVMHNNGAFTSFGVQSRYAFVFDTLGVKPASTSTEPSLHGQPISSEFIQQANPDILYIVDRTAVMERRPTINAEHIANPLLRQTNAWKNGRVIFVDADAWYITAASVTSLKMMIDDVLKGYADPSQNAALSQTQTQSQNQNQDQHLRQS